MKVAIYARVSTGDQDETLQIPRLQQYAANAGWEVVQIYTDQSTGKNINRPGWQHLMSDARRHHFDRILITKLDRMMRSVGLLLEELTLLDRFEIQVFTLDFGIIDLKSPGNRFTMTILGAIAEWEGGIISARTKEALEAKKARGEKLGRPKIDLPIHTIALRRIEGQSWAKIARELGFKTATLSNRHEEVEVEIERIRAGERATIAAILPEVVKAASLMDPLIR